MISAIAFIENKEKISNEVCRETGIRKFKLSNQINMKVPVCRKMGLSTVLSDSEENRIVEWILAKSRVRFPIPPETFKNSVKKVYRKLNKPNLFTDDHHDTSG